jgi:outer membrane biosynthesis protein TonB
MHQEGGAHRAMIAGVDAAKSPLGDYDAEVIAAVTDRWYNLLDQQRYADDRTGRVVVQFKLEYDGTVREVEVVESNVGDVLSYICQAAIEDAAPFEKWPDDMRREIGANYREIKFTFIYY